MSFHISKQVGWGSNYTPDITDPVTYKYFFCLEADVDVTNVVGNVATIRVYGTYRVLNSATGGPPNSIGAASDFATLAIGSWDPSAYAFDHNQNYYLAAIPMMPNASQEFIDNKILVQFRGDTYYATGNLSSVYVKGSGLVINSDGTTFDRTYNFDQTFNITVPTTGDIPIITWTSSGWGSPHTYDWLDQQTWASWFDLEWTATLLFNDNGGSGGPGSATTRGAGETLNVTIPNGAPTRTNYRFEGWADSSSATTAQYQPGDSITIQKTSPTKTIYAVWRKYYRPGKIKTANGWENIDRDAGGDGQKTSSSWQEMRTIDAPTGKNDPPEIYHDSDWYNQRGGTYPASALS